MNNSYFTILRLIYLFSTLISIFETTFFLEQQKGKVNKNQLLLYISACIVCVGYTMLCFSSNKIEAFITYFVYFIGIVLSTLLLLFVIADLCNIKIPLFAQRIGFVYALVLIIFVATTKDNHLYFKTFDIAYRFGTSYLKSTFGPLHIYFYIFVGICIITAILLALITIFSKNQVSRKSLLLYIVIMLIMTSSYLIPKFINLGIEIMNFGYTIALGVLLPIIKHTNMNDMTSNILNVYERRKDFGYICFDLKKRYMGSNAYALKVFPSLADLKIDEKVPESDFTIQTKLISLLNFWDENEENEKPLENNGISVICSIKYLMSGKKNTGYLIELKDNTNQQSYINFINSYNMELSNTVEDQTEKLLLIQESIITGMASMVESRDNSTGGHILRTSDCVKIFIDKIKENDSYQNYSPIFLDNITKAAPMHDLGKIAVDDVILRKPGKFTPEEYEQMKKHPVEGARIVAKVLENIDDEVFEKIAVNIAHFHHERWDGTGYPDKLKKEEIPFEARIMALADVFDALVSKRCYKDAFSYDEAFKIIMQSLGTQFDPELGRIFICCRPELEDLYNNYLKNK